MDNPNNNLRWLAIAIIMAALCGVAFLVMWPEEEYVEIVQTADFQSPSPSSVQTSQQPRPEPTPPPATETSIPEAQPEDTPAESPETSPSGVSVSGTAWNKTTREPIPGATVRLFEGESGPFSLSMPDRADASTETTANGTYSFPNVAAGTYTVFIDGRDIGYVAQSKDARSFDFDASTSKTGVDLWLEKGGTLTGRVLNPSGKPIPDAGLGVMPTKLDGDQFDEFDPFAYEREREGSGSSETGEFELNGVVLDTPVRVMARAKGYAPAWSEPVTIDSASPTAEITITLPQGSAVSGKVTYEDGTPVPNAEVSISMGMSSMLSGQSLPGGHAECNDAGEFNFPNIAAGEYEIKAYDFSDDSDAATFVSSPLGFGLESEEPKIQVDGINAITDLVVVIAQPEEGTGQITGVVLTENGSPAANVNVYSLNTDSWDDFKTTTDANGNFTLAKLQPGEYDISVDTDDALAEQDDVPEGSHITLRMLPYLKITGRVIDTDGNLVPNAQIECREDGMPFDFDFGDEQNIRTDNDGTFTIASLEEDTYTITAKNSLKGSGRSKSIALKRGQQVPAITIRLVPGVSVSGVVLGKNGDTLPGATVSLMRFPDNPNAAMFFEEAFMGKDATTSTDGEGRFTMPQIPAGKYRLDAKASGYAGGRIDEIEVANTNVTNLRVTMTHGGCLEGVALNDDHSPREGQMVNAMGDNGNFSTNTDSDGRYKMCSLPEGSYMVMIVDMSSPAEMDGFDGLDFEPSYVEIVDGETTEYDFAPPENGVELSGTLSGELFPGIALTLRSADTPSVLDFDPNDRESLMQVMQVMAPKTALLDNNGNFSFGLIEPGDYIVDVRDTKSVDFDMDNDGFDFSDMLPGLITSKEVTLEEGKPLTVEFELP